MKQYLERIKLSKRLLHDFLWAIFLFASFCFINIEIAAFSGVLLFSILATRTIILEYNPGYIRGYHILYDQQELDIPKGVDVLNISKLPSINHLYAYAELIRGLLFPPSTIIIRFCGIAEMRFYEIQTLKSILQKLHSSGIAVILADVGNKLINQFKKYGIVSEVGLENVFNDISDAMLGVNTKFNKSSANEQF